MRYLYLAMIAFLLSFGANAQCYFIQPGTPVYRLDTTYITFYATTDLVTYPPSSYQWYFSDDSSFATGDSVTHMFLMDSLLIHGMPDFYTVALSVVDSSCSSVDTETYAHPDIYSCNNSSFGDQLDFYQNGFNPSSITDFPNPIVYSPTGSLLYSAANWRPQITINWGTAANDSTVYPPLPLGMTTGALGDPLGYYASSSLYGSDSAAFQKVPPYMYGGVYHMGESVTFFTPDGSQSCPTNPQPSLNSGYIVAGPPAIPLITGNTVLCVGDTLRLVAQDTSVQFHNLYHYVMTDTGVLPSTIMSSGFSETQGFGWLAPTGVVSFESDGDSTVYIPSVTLADSGMYIFGVGIYGAGLMIYDTIYVTIGPVAAPISGPAHLCAGTTAAFIDTVTGGTWSSGNTSLATVDAYGNVTGLHYGVDTIYYSVMGTCSGAVAKVAVTIDSAAAIWSPTTSTGCVGVPYTFYGSGGTWSSDITAIATIDPVTGILIGLVPGIVVVDLTSPWGCVASDSFTIYPLPTITATAASPVVCGGLPDSVIASGGVSYTWSAGVSCSFCETGSVYTGGTYTVTGTDAHGCVSTGEVTVTSGSVPTVSAANNGPLCFGDVLDLTGTISGSTDYHWIGPSGYTDTTLNPVIPGITSSGSYTLVATNSCGTSTGSTDVIVNALPVITASATYPALCTGVSDTLSASGAVSYSWSPSAGLSCATCSISAVTLSGTYTVTGTASTGCMSTGIVSVAGDAVPTVTANNNGPLCPGEILDLTAIISGGALTTSWSGPDGFTSSSTDTAVVGVTEANVGVYTLVVTNSCGSSSATTTFGLSTLTVTATATPSSCGDLFTLSASGASSYTWLPSSGLSCTACPDPTTADAGTYTVTGTTTAGCSGSDTVTVGGNRISGYISFSGPAPDTLDMKVWLIQFNPSDSSLTALDSTLTCLSAGVPYYEFDGEAAGSYMVKGTLLYGNAPGSSGYIPTYGLSSPYWDTSATITHTSGFNSQNINMVYGTVPSGPGFIGGLVTSGADKGTSTGIPVVGMMIYLKNAATDHVLTYTYTDATGAYSFGGLANGSYKVFPEDYQYTTIVSPDITLTTANDSATGVNFVQHTISKTITPATTTGVKQLSSVSGINIYPNPTNGELNVQWLNQLTGNADIELTDVIGRRVLKAEINITSANGEAKLDVSGLKEGIYMVTIKSAVTSFTGKITIQH